MKRFILLSIFLFAGLGQAEAQQDKKVVVGATEEEIITIETEEVQMVRVKVAKDIKRYDAKRGYQQEARFSWWWSSNYFDQRNYSAFRFSYIGGRRFNDYFFAGVGVGLDIGLSNTRKVKAYKQDTYYSCYHEFFVGGQSRGSHCGLPMQSIAIPLYANFKGYFTKTKFAPYLSFSAGARFSTRKTLMVYNKYGTLEGEIKYGAVKAFFEVAPGVTYRRSDSRSFTFQIGYYTHCVKAADSWYYVNSIDYYNDWSHGLTLSVGMTF